MRPSPAPAGPAPLTAAPQAFSAQTHVGAQFEPRVPGTCFDLFGMVVPTPALPKRPSQPPLQDLMFDADGKPWLLEVNNAPGIYKERDAATQLSLRRGPLARNTQFYVDEMPPAVLSTFAVDRENDDSTRATAFARELRRCMVGLPFDGGRLRLCPRDDGAACIAPEDERALWLAFDELCTAEARGFKAAFPRAGAKGFHIGPPPRIDRLLWLWQEQCRGTQLCGG